MEIQRVPIWDVPEILRSTIEKYREDMAKYGEVELLQIQKKLDTPYKDKSQIVTTYKAFLQHDNYLSVFRYEPHISPNEIEKYGLTIGEITTFIKHSVWMKQAAKDALE